MAVAAKLPGQIHAPRNQGARQMIPSAVAAEVNAALRDFLATGFTPSNPELAGVMDDFLAAPDNLAKGPYLSIALPFQRAPEGGEHFAQVPLGFPPYRHQRTAFSRLAGSGARSTVIATGTGSGKTECFLYPILDHCRAQSGTKGIKAILVYPMNALATDQARRIAATIEHTPALRGKVTAGLFIGQAEESPHTGMGPEHVITDRATLRESPPDILLTNYKMLDFLLLRPRDQRLWRFNEPGTLRYLVVDELHTFDGAQGTDLACLVRRLRARLGGTRENLVCVGTSATLGGPGSEVEMLKYVRSIFDQDFDRDAIVGEVRQGIDEFLGGALISRHLTPRDNLSSIVDVAAYGSEESFLRAQHELFLGAPITGDFDAIGWREDLASQLREHTAFVNLLRVLDGQAKPLGEVVQRLRRSLPVASDHEALGVLNGLCALISAARVTATGRVGPFLQVGLHFWVRELRRMVCSLHEPAEAVATPELARPVALDEARSDSAPAEATVRRRLRHSDDLKADERSVHLPLLQCRECHTTAWGTVKRPGEARIEQDLRMFYNRFFARDVDVQYLFPGEPPPGVPGARATICGACGLLDAGDTRSTCTGCGEARLVPVFRPVAVVTQRRGDRQVQRLSRDCPYCGASEALIILGARASSLLSVALGQVFASRYNDDHKIIAFSDNVQDAAHRAGFFSARTWQNSMRAAIAQVIAAHDGITLAELPDRVVAWWSDATVNPRAFGRERFVSEFIAPDRLWLQDFVALQREDRLPAKSDLPDLVARRMRWETLAELGFRSTIGRTLERTRAATVAVDRDALQGACDAAHLRLREQIGGLRELERKPVLALLGVLRRMRERGAVHHPLLRRYLASGGDHWVLGQDKALPFFGRRSPVPVFPAEQAGRRGIEALVVSGRAGKSWYQSWVEKVLTPFEPLAATRFAPDVLLEVFNALQASGLLEKVDAGDGHVWALDPGKLHVTAGVAVLRCERSPRSLVVAEGEAELWLGAPCFDLGAQDTYGTVAREPPTWFGRLYHEQLLRRIVAAEHTALVPREQRDHLQQRFAAEKTWPWEPNLLSATPTLEMGIDIGDLSTVVLCSVPPAPANYVQRVGRAGRRDGNAFTLTVATGQAHDLYFYAEPREMLASTVAPPGVFLNASAVLERQLTAFCFDSWVASGVSEDAVPQRIRAVLENVEKGKLDGFPYSMLDYAQTHADDLLEAFLDAFAHDLSEASRDYLRTFLEGDAQGHPPLRYRLTSRLLEVVEEARSLRAQVDALKRRIDSLERGVRDEATDIAIDEFKRERAGLQGLLRLLNGRDTFNFFTDEGLLPNYAFPEPGVTLKSVIYRKREGGDEGAGGFEQDAFEYERPGSAALSELAPENEFYAGGRHVRIDRVDLRVSPIEPWRLCRNCSYCAKVDVADDAAVCPRCGDAMWSDTGQRHNMLRLRQVHASTPDRRSRITDERDDREPLFYTRELVADFDPEMVERAYAIAKGDLPFGFEYIRAVTFREMNFGRLDSTGQQTTFAGVEMPRGGFRLCRHCGKVQLGAAGAPEHTRNCPARERDDDAIVECLYLYREFSSEAVRMLLPVADVMGSKRRVSSFIAALELGLRQRFGGKLDHLRAMNHDAPDAGTNTQRRFLMLYDTVPGGTGYLKELMAEPARLLSVFEAARRHLKACECNKEPERDGCYRCVYAYRRSRDMESTSRNTAVEILDGILEHAQELQPVEGLSKLKSNALVKSVLEARFVEALGRMKSGGQPVLVRPDLVQGKPGYVLKVAERTYYMEPQVDLGASDGVLVASRPDFVIRSARAAPGQPVVAVFTDGFDPHRDLTGGDSVKRMALVKAGFLVWSLTWQDVETAFGKAADATDLLGGRKLAGPIQTMREKLDGQWQTAELRARLAGTSLELLLSYLAEPDITRWKRAVFTWLLPVFDPTRMASEALRTRFDAAVAALLPAQVREALAEFDGGKPVAGLGRWLADGLDAVDLFVVLGDIDPDEVAVVVHLHDDTESRMGKDYRRQWNGVLRLYNLLQFLPGAWWTTKVGVEQQAYPEFVTVAGGGPTVAIGASAAWSEVLELATAELAGILEQLAEAGAPVPEVGFELAGADGAVVAEAELAWTGPKVVVLTGEQADGATAFASAGWRVVMADDRELRATLAALLGEDE